MRVGLASRRGAAWSIGLRSYLADHTSGISVSLILDSSELVGGGFSVVFVDDQARSLTPAAVASAVAANTFVIGLTDERNGRGRAHLETLGAQRIMAVSTPTPELAALLSEIGPRMVRTGSEHPTERVAARRRQSVLSVWSPALAGAGLTEALVGVADRLGDKARVLVVEATDTAGILAARLARSAETTLGWALEKAAVGPAGLGPALAGVGEAPVGRFDLIAQAHAPGGPPPIDPEALGALIDAGLERYDHVAVRVGPLLAGGPGMSRDRAGAARAMAARADVLVVSAPADPVGALSLVNARATALDLAPTPGMWAILGRASKSRYEQARLAEVVAGSTRRAPFAGVSFLPEDAAVARARWNAELVVSGPWAKAIAALAGEVAVPAPTPMPVPKPTELVNSLGVVVSA